MAQIIFDMPMDETANSPIAYDFSAFSNHGTVHGGGFVAGHDGNAYSGGGNDYIIAPNPIPDLAYDFTLVYWAKTNQNPAYGTPAGWAFQFAFSDNSIEQYRTDSIQVEVWQSFCLVKSSSEAKIYIDGQLAGQISFIAGNPTEWAIKQIYSGDAFPYTLPMTFGGNAPAYAMADVDNVLIYNMALTPDEIARILNPVRNVLYRIDGIPFEDYDVFVSASMGVIDALELKDPTIVDWAGEHGQIVDLNRPRYKPREITLNCFMYGGNPLTHATKFTNFIRLFQSPGLHRLTIEIDERKPLHYTVYLPNSTDTDKQWRWEGTAGKFQLKLKDPQPIRRIIRFYPTDGNAFTAKIRFTCPSVVNIYWGDDKFTNDVLAGADLLISHEYLVPKKYYDIMITGTIDDITNFSHNGILIWNKL